MKAYFSKKIYQRLAVKPINLVMDMFLDTYFHGYQIISNFFKGEKTFCWDLEFMDCPIHEIH